MRQLIHKWLILFLVFLLTGCATIDSPKPKTSDGLPSNWQSVDVNQIPNATPRVLPKSKYGNPKSYVVFGKRYYTLESAKGYRKKGIASWYGTKFHERLTSSGEPYNMFAMTAANKVLPLPTFVRVTNLENGRSIIVKVNDRGPFHENRIIDLSFVAAKKLGMIEKGTAPVEVTAIDPRHPNRSTSYYEHHPKRRIEIYLQVGAFRHYSNAARLRNAVYKKTHLETFISTRHTGHHNIYRVRVGPFRSVETADEWVERLKRDGYQDILEVVI